VDVKITSCTGGKLHVEWKSPEGVVVNKWVVRCYNNSGFDETKATKNNYYTFTVPDTLDAYTVEVSAEGQMAFQSDKIDKGSVSVSFTQRPTISQDGFITLNWTSESTPKEGWIVSYKINDSLQPTIQVNETTIRIPILVYGAKYTFSVTSADPVKTLGKETFCNTPAYSEEFVFHVGETQYTADDMAFSLCTRPEVGEWTHTDEGVGYTETFTKEEHAGLIVFLDKALVKFEEPETPDGEDEPAPLDDSFTFGLIITDENGNIISADALDYNWNTMWNNSHCYLNLPHFPSDPGVYTLNITINAMSTTQLTFAVN
jgi:hypothetical protein